MYALILPLMVAVNSALKKAGMPSKYAPMVNLIGGLAAGVAIALYAGDSIEHALQGVIAGLASGGAYDVVKSHRNTLK